MPPPSSRLEFLSLPLELRLRIYQYALVRKPQAVPHREPSFEHPATPTILRTYKYIYEEASPVPLSRENTFLVYKPERILNWLIKIGRANTKLLRHICIFGDPVYSTEKSLFSGGEGPFWY